MIEYWLTIEPAYVNVTTSEGTSLQRSGSLINGTLPGPVLTATDGDTLIIHVKNNQDPASREASLHWHGMLQPGTPFYDGVPGVSQCGICVYCEETYKFQATPAGTHWYHSHSGVQYADGQLGALIIYPREDAELPEWEMMVEDEFIILASEWSAVDPYTEYVELKAGEDLGGTYNGIMEADVAWQNWLVNGKDGTEFHIKSNKSYRFRFINAAANYGINVSVAEHEIQLVMVDAGTYLEPSNVDYFRAEVGSRYDFIINSTAAPGRYPIYIVDYSGANIAMPAVIVVDGGNADMDSGPAQSSGVHNTPSYPSPLAKSSLPSASRTITLKLTGTESMDMGAGSMNTETTSTGMTSMDDGAESTNTGTASTSTASMDMGRDSMKTSTSPTGTTSMDMGVKSIDGEDASYAWGIDDINGVLPSVPVYISAGAFGMDPKKVKVLQVDVDEVVDILFDNSQTGMTHPFHSHGHKFWVLGTAGKDEELALNEVNPIERDTIDVPQYGKAMIRIKFSNPGPWIMHCHIDFHMIAGMFMVILIGDSSKDWPIPEQDEAVRLCGSNEDFMSMMNNAWSSQFVKRLVDQEPKKSGNSRSEFEGASSASTPSRPISLFMAVVAGVFGSNDYLNSMIDAAWSVTRPVDPESKRSISSASEIEDASSSSARLMSVTVFMAIMAGVLCHW